MILLDLLKAALLGIVQGITEWLPVSSTGHLLLLEELIPFSSAVSVAATNLFTVVIQLGSILAVLVLYFTRLNPFSRKKSLPQQRATFGLWGKILLAAIPAVVAGLLFNDWIKEIAYTNRASKCFVIAGALVLYGVAFIIIERLHKNRTPRVNTAEGISPKTALGIGGFQMLALIPGTSRSGSTIMGSILLGVSRPAAAEFSFFLAVPMMIGASGLDFVKYIADFGFHFTATELGVLLVGTLVAFLVSLAAIRFMMEFVRRHSFEAFGWYRIILAVAVIVWYFLA